MRISAAKLIAMLPGSTIEIALDDTPLALKVGGETVGYGALRRAGPQLLIEVISFCTDEDCATG